VRKGRGPRALMPAILAAPAYRRLWTSGLVYYHAYMCEIVIAGWTVLQLTGSPFAVGLVGFSRMLPMLVLGLILGTMADRFRGSTVLLLVQIGGATTALAMTALFATGRVQLWQICLLTGLFGCCWTGDFSARRSLIAQLQEPERVGNAMSLETVSMLGSKIAATALGGVLLALDGPRLAYGWLACVYATGILMALRLRQDSAAIRREPPAAVSLLALVRTGWTAAVRTPLVRAVLLVTVVMNLFVFCYQQIIAVIAGEILRVDAPRMGLLAGIDGVGAIVVATLLATRTRPVRQGAIFLAGACGAAMLVAALALSRSYPLSLVVQIALGACSGAFGSMQTTLIAGATAPALRARAMGILAMAIGVTPFGILLSGTLSAAIGPSPTLAGLGLAALALNLAILARNRVLVEGLKVEGRRSPVPGAAPEVQHRAIEE
jgi:MFS family permease